ncbi:MAG: C39 family peptidase [Clostridium sp.]
MIVIITSIFSMSCENKSNEISVPTSVLIDAPLISQFPELKNGCEVTSLTMMLNYSGIKVDKMTLAKKIPKDDTAATYDQNGEIVKWGNPDNGFVGDITGKNPGYSIDPEPLIGIINEYLPDKAIDLTNASFDELQKTLSNKIPIVVWVTCDFKTPEKNAQWNCNGETIDATFSQHAVLLTGYDEKNLYYNDPHSNTKNKSVSKKTFLEIWNAMGKKALSYKN